MQLFQSMFYFDLLSAFIRAQVITLTSDPDTNGSYCPGRVIFTCNGTSVANGLEWVLNGMIYNIFTLTFGDSDFPRRVSSDSSNITVRVISASLTEHFQGIDIVSVLSVISLNPIQDNTVSCRTVSGSSSHFVVGKRDHASPREIKAFLVISSMDNKLLLTWTFSDSRCEGLDYNFRIILTYSYNNSATGDTICGTNCEASFPILFNDTTRFKAEVWAINQHGQLVGMPSSRIFNIYSLTTINSQNVSFTTIIEDRQGFTNITIGVTTAIAILLCLGAMITVFIVLTTYCYNKGRKREKPRLKSPLHEYEEITKNHAKTEESHKTSIDTKVNMMEDNVAYSVHNSTLLTMTDCEAYGVPITQK